MDRSSSLVDHLPYRAEGLVVVGFQRGSKQLGIPTANFPETVVRALPDSFACGVYYGWAKVGPLGSVYKMSLCVGWNPYYKNTVKTMETHIFHEFPEDFYGEILKVIIVGYLRPMCGFDSLDALITAIHNDNRMAAENLDSPDLLKYREDAFFSAAPVPAPETTPDSGLHPRLSNSEASGVEKKDPMDDKTCADDCSNSLCECMEKADLDDKSSQVDSNILAESEVKEAV